MTEYKSSKLQFYKYPPLGELHNNSGSKCIWFILFIKYFNTVGCVVPCSPDAIQHTQPHLQPATVTRCSKDVLNSPSIPVLWLKQFWNCILKLCWVRQMGSKINSNDCNSYGDTWRETRHESPKFCSHLCENADGFIVVFCSLYPYFRTNARASLAWHMLNH